MTDCCDNCRKKAKVYFEFFGDKLCKRCLEWAIAEEEQLQLDAEAWAEEHSDWGDRQ